MHHSIKFRHAGPGFRNQPFQTVRDRKARILWCCQSLPGKNQVALLVDQHKVRERTADIDTDADAFSDITHSFAFSAYAVVLFGECRSDIAVP